MKILIFKASEIRKCNKWKIANVPIYIRIHEYNKIKVS